MESTPIKLSVGLSETVTKRSYGKKIIPDFLKSLKQLLCFQVKSLKNSCKQVIFM